MKRSDLTEKILDTKRAKGWSWKHITEEIGGMSEVLVIGALLGQHKLVKPLAKKAAVLFELSPAERPGVESDHRGTVRRRHHVGDRLQHGVRARAEPEGRPREDHHVGQVPAVQILW
jgi:hypothetical protein